MLHNIQNFVYLCNGISMREIYECFINRFKLFVK